MTREQVISASPEQLNEWTAVKVMGWKVDDLFDTSGNGIYRGDILDGTAVWGPARYYDDAFELWQHLRNLGWEMTLSCDQKIKEPWDCRMFYKEQKRVIAHGPTATIAICRAALLTTGEN